MVALHGVFLARGFPKVDVRYYVVPELPESCWWWNNMLLITNLPIPLLVATSYSNTRRAFLGSATSVATSAIIIVGPPPTAFAQDDDGTLS